MLCYSLEKKKKTILLKILLKSLTKLKQLLHDQYKKARSITKKHAHASHYKFLQF